MDAKNLAIQSFIAAVTITVVFGQTYSYKPGSDFDVKQITMEKSVRSTAGIVVSPHYLASQSGLAILRQGGTAMEAVVAAAATIAVVAPFDNSIGSDGFWQIIPPGGEPFIIDASGPAGSLVSTIKYPGNEIPFQGPTAAITLAGTIAGWKDALNYVSESGYNRVSLNRLLYDAIRYAEHGFPVSATQVNVYNELKENNRLTNDLKRYYGNATTVGQIFKQPLLANTLKELAKHGLDSFYRGPLASKIYQDMKSLGMPFELSDLLNYRSARRHTLKLNHSEGVLSNTPPPTQGIVSLAILGMLDNLEFEINDEESLIHFAVEATKQGFRLRDKYITDPRYMTVRPESLITPYEITKLASAITAKSSPYESGQGPRGTVWIGAIDRMGYSVSFIQSLFQSFGSGVVLPSTGILWHNRGVAFSLNKSSIFALEPGKKPFHTLNPAAAKLKDGRVLLYGTSGGDGQPQTQAAIFHRYVIQKIGLQKSINLLRWSYGRYNEESNSTLNIEEGYDEKIIEMLRLRGHKVIVRPSSKFFGYAGMIVKHPNGILEGASDPRSEGSALGF